ncbi:MAG: DNRLRE domain-containing protein, partial [Candidatus Thermoplasmatota archaeon]|nr:DNRLRE domain-containing protein [Candidatus Thermoplasmatota archaeon]
SADSRTDSGFDLAAGTFTFPTNWGLGIGDHIWWRISFIEDGDRSYWSDSMMYVPNLNSTYLTGNEHQMRLSDGNASASTNQVNAVPECEDTYLDSSSTSTNNDDSYLVISSTEVALFKCDMAGLILPEGMAIQSAVLRTYAWQFTTFSNVPINVYSGTTDWNETGATWDTRDGTRSWASSGADGTDRISLLDSQTITTNGDDWFEWNITSAAQAANRWGTPLSVIMTSSSGTSASFQDSETGSTGPEIVITYGIGDDISPDVPVGMAPSGDEWVVSDNLLMQGIVRPEHSWTTPLMNANAIEIQIDQDISMSSSNLETFQSWVDTSAFDLTNGTFTPSSDMTEGERYYWRMRGISSSGQVGNWSATSSYVIPDVVSSMLDSDTSEVEMHHNGFLPEDNWPEFFDTYFDERPAYENTSYASSTSLTLFSPPDIGSGNFDINGNFSNDRGALFKIPINENLTIPQPNDIRIVGTELHFNVISGHGSGVRVYAAPVDPFNESATGRTMDGSTNWSSRHTFGNGNVSIDDGVAKEVTNSGSNSINITRLMQLAADSGEDYLYLALTAAQDSYTSTWNGISISSVDANIATDRPYLKIQYRNGSAPVPNTTGTPDTPNNGELVWNTNGIILDPDTSPTLEWLTPSGWSSSWDWMLRVDCTGQSSWSLSAEYDSRSDSGFDLTGPSFTFPSTVSLAQDSTCSWSLQSVVDDMLGPISSRSIFGVPNDLTNSIDSTHESLTAQTGMAHSDFDMYELVDDTEIRSNLPNTNYGQSASMYVGRSGFGIVSVDLTHIPIPEPWMSSDASIDLYKMGSTTGNHQIAVYNIFDEWDESATWNNASSNTPWSTQSGYLDNTMSPISTTIVNTTYGWYSWDITEAVQQARVRGDDIVRLLFRDTSDPSNSNVYFATSEYSQNQYSPRLNMIYSSGNIWIPEDASSLNPSLGTETTMWNSTALLPTPPDSVDLSWSHSLNNHSWDFQVDTDPFFGTPDSFNSNANSSLFTTTTGAPSSTSFSFPSTSTWDDAWYYWRVRGVDSSQYGNWTEGGSFRVPDSVVGTSDGAGNYSVTLERGDVFETSGYLPSFPDTYIDSAGGPGQTQNHGTSVSLNVGSSTTAGAIVVSLIEMDLG